MQRADDPRLGQLFISRDQWLRDKSEASRSAVALISVPSDEGVKRNGGRVGASAGPGFLMNLLPHLGSVDNRELNVNLQKSGVRLIDYGETECGPLEMVHQTLQNLVYKALACDRLFPICLGGGNDQSAANGLAWIRYLRDKYGAAKMPQKLVVVNVDAHLDVRPLIPDPSDPGSPGLAHSGSPFRQLLEAAQGIEQDLHLIEFASQGQQCAAAHVDYVLDHNGEIFWLSELGSPSDSRCLRNNRSGSVERLRHILKQCTREQSRVFFSFDVDSIRASDCPGVSCSSPIGLTAHEALCMCYEAGKCPVVDLMDISEFNPRVELTITGRLIVNMIYHFLVGYAERP